MMEALDEVLDLMLLVIVLALLVNIFITNLSYIIDEDNYGYGLMEEKSAKASDAMMADLRASTGFTTAHFVMLPAVDDGFSNHYIDNSHVSHLRKIRIVKPGTSAWQMVEYNMRDISLNRVTPVVNSSGTAGVASTIEASSLWDQRKYDLYLNRFGDLLFKEKEVHAWD